MSLSDSFAKNRLPLEEYERLVEYINKIESERELALIEKIVAEHGGSETPAYEDEDDDDDDVRDYKSYRPSVNLAVLSSRTFSGPLKSDAEYINVLGTSSINIRKADLRKRKTAFNVVSVLGDSTIYVESGIRVRNKTIPILGSSTVNSKVSKLAQQDDPEIVISGVALLGSVNVKLIKD